jgi:nucleoside 2-deoxyribosyltransferase
VRKKAQTRKRYLVFVSHSEKDGWIARQIAAQIERKCLRYGVKTFLYEKHIAGGEAIPDSIRNNIQQCDEFLVLLSRYSIDRPWVLIEMGAAWALEKPIIAITDKVTPEEMPAIIAPRRAIDLNALDEYLGQLYDRVRKARR